MIALGLNGWNDGTHDPAAAVVADGHVVAFVEEERFSRRKHAVGAFPHQAVRSALAIGGLGPADVDVVAYGWDLERFYRTRNRTLDLRDAASVITGMSEFRGVELRWIRHHDAHAASAFFGSGFDSAAILVVDAEGESESASIYVAGLDGVRCLRRFGREVSLGLMYRAASDYCGFGQYGAGKTMGLSSYAPDEVEPLPIVGSGDSLESPFGPSDAEDEIISGWQSILESRFGAPGARAPASSAGKYPPPEAHKPEAAAAAQATVAATMRFYVREALRLTGSSRLCIAGGVALNCVENAALLLDKELELTALHIPPYPHDAGVALGAAQSVFGVGAVHEPARADHGPVASTSDAHAVAMRAGLAVQRVDSPAESVADLLMQDRVVGWVQGRMEVGPRALGCRSILALPSSRETRDRINNLKGREPWRPLAPSVLSEDAPRLFDCPAESPFMLLSLPMSPEGVRQAPGAAHIDGTARLQTVSMNGSRFRRLLEALRERSGLGCVLNTSFNARGEPIVRSSDEAIATAVALGIDALIVDDLLLTLR